MMTYLFKLLVLLTAMGLMACQNQHSTPKPIGYHRITFPENSYSQLSGDYPFICDISEYANFVKAPKSDTNKWYNIEYPDYNATIHLSYYNMDTALSAYIETSRQFAMQHIPKATAIKQKTVYLPEHSVYGLSYSIQGSETASPIQFYLTDSVENFLRGALYFNNTPNNDSVGPVIEYIDDDIIRMMETLRWK